MITIKCDYCNKEAIDNFWSCENYRSGDDTNILKYLVIKQRLTDKGIVDLTEITYCSLPCLLKYLKVIF